MSDEDIGRLVLSGNAKNAFLAFHEIAQIHVAAQLYEKYGFGIEYGKSNIKLEETVHNAMKITGKHVQNCYEVDIYAEISPLAKPMAWEVKAISYQPDSWKSRDAHDKYSTMLDVSLPEMYRGDNTNIDTMMNIPVIGQILMRVEAPDDDPGFIYYSLYREDVDEETGEILYVDIPLNVAKDYVQVRKDNSEAVLEFVISAATYGLLDWGMTPGVKKEMSKGGDNVIQYYEYIKKALENLDKVG